MRSLWRHFTSGVLALIRRRRGDHDLDEEVGHYLAEAAAELVARGATPEAARRIVRLRYGGRMAAREAVRSYGWENTIASTWTDLRIAHRRLARDPGFAVVAILTLGVGIGATTAIFSVVRPVLFDPLPYPDADRIVAVADRSTDGSPVPVAFGTYLELRARSNAFESAAVYRPWQPTLTGGEEPERLEGQRVSAEYLAVLGVEVHRGSGFDAAADRPGGADLVVLSHRLWERRFASDPSVVGGVVHLDSRPFSVAGVMAPGFHNATDPDADVWALLQYEPAPGSFDTREWGHHLEMVGRLRTGVDLEQARMLLATVAENPVADFGRPPWAALTEGLSTRHLRDAVTLDARPTMLVLLGAVALMLGIACVNLTILLLARGARRQGELAMRRALGASQARLLRSLLAESLLLVGLGGIVGILAARAGLAGLVAVSPAGLTRLDAVELDLGALAVATALPALISVLFGLAPAVARLERQTPRTIRAANPRSARALPLRRALVVSEVALAVILLTGAGLLLRSTQRLFAIAPGFDPSATMVFQISTTGLEPGDGSTHRFFDDALDAARRLPGIRAAALTSQLPLSGDVDVYGLTLADAPAPRNEGGAAYRYAVSPEYFETMRIEQLRGRRLGRADIETGPPAAVLSASLARRLFPGGNAIGARLHLGPTAGQPYTVVGVVGDVKQESLGTSRADAVYIAARQWHWADRVRWLVVRTDRDGDGVVAAVREAIHRVDGNQPIVRVQSLRDLVARSEAQRRFVSMVLAAFSLSALTLAGIGLFGVLSGSVTERAREIGVRSAIGASRVDIVALVVHQGLTMTVVGAAIGAATAVVASRALVTLLFEVSRIDLPTHLGVVAILTVVAAISCWFPALRAARMDPVTTLRAN